MEFCDNLAEESGIAALNRAGNQGDEIRPQTIVRIPHRMTAEHGIVSGVRLGKVLMVSHAVPRGFNGDLMICVCVSGITQSTRPNAMLNVRNHETVPGSPL